MSPESATYPGYGVPAEIIRHAVIYGHVRPRRHRMTAGQHRRARAKAFLIWREETCIQVTA